MAAETNSTVTLETIVGRGLAGLLTRHLAAGERPQLRVSGFSADEVAVAVETAGLDDDGTSEALVLVSGQPVAQLEGLLGAAAFTASGRTATWGRNHNTNGFVYFQLNNESDSQSTKAMCHVRDSEFFESAETWSLLVNAITPKGRGEVAPELRRLIDGVLESYQFVRRMQLRPFASFLQRVAARWAELDYGPVTTEQASDMVASALPGLGLFRHQALARAIAADKTRAAQREMRQLIYGSSLTRPSGAELDREKLRSQLEAVSLDKDKGVDRSLKSNVAEFLAGNSTAALDALDFSAFSQVVKPPHKEREPVGTAILHFLTDEGNDELIDLYEKTDFQVSLDDKDEQAADDFIRSEFFSTLPSKLKRDVRRLAPKRVAFADPLLGLLDTIEEIIADDGKVKSLTIGLGEESPLLSALFSFLYGPSLLNLRADLDVQGVDIRLPDSFKSESWLAVLGPDAVDNEDEESEFVDDATELSIHVELEPGGRRTYKWQPESPEMWLLWVRCICDPAWREQPGLRLVPGDLAGVTRPGSLARRNVDIESFPTDWLEKRRLYLEQIATHGVSARLVRELLKAWATAIGRLVRDADESVSNELVAFLASDCVRIQDSQGKLRDSQATVWMLGCHPLRLRWFFRWCGRLTSFLKGLLTNRFDVSVANPDYFRSRIATWSPHRYPPVVSINPGSVHLAAEERGNCERYLPAGQTAQERDVLDASSVKLFVNVALEYLEMHPHKRDGLHVLFWLGQEASTAQQFISQFVRKAPDARLVLHVVAPASSRGIERLVDAYNVGALLHTSRHSHFPLLEIRHHVAPDTGELPEALRGAGLIDLALVPFLFGGTTDLNVQHNTGFELRAWQNPLTVRPISPARSERRLQIDLLPELADHPLHVWADAVTRSYNNGPPSLGNHFFLRTTADMQAADSLMYELRQAAGTIVTLDIGITNAQLNQLDRRPDVVHVTTNLGKNGDYSLTVGADCFNSLRHRLRELIDRQLPGFDATRRTPLIDRILSEIVVLGPELTLKAAARSAFAAELLGRAALLEWSRASSDLTGDVLWLSLDAYHPWFSGRHADLLRVNIIRQPTGPELHLLVCESKFSPEGGAPLHARQEIRATIDLFRDVLPARPGDGKDRLDHDLWWVAFANALQSASFTQARPLDDSVHAQLARGEFAVASIEGRGFIWRPDLKQDEIESQEADLIVTSIGGTRLAELLLGAV